MYMTITCCPIPLHHQQIGVKLLGLIFFSLYYWQFLAIIGNYWLLLVLFFCEKYYYYWLLLDYTHIINYWDYSKSIIAINLFGSQLLQLFAFIAIIEVKC